MPSGKRPAGILVAFVDVEEVIAERFHGTRGPAGCVSVRLRVHALAGYMTVSH